MLFILSNLHFIVFMVYVVVLFSECHNQVYLLLLSSTYYCLVGSILN